MSAIRIASLSETGDRSGNEDDLRHGTAGHGPYAVLADGAGGHQRGAEASRRAVQCMQRLFCSDEASFSPAGLTRMVRLAHAELQQHQNSDEHLARMHCTIVALWINAQTGHVLWTHVGDSRLYRIRQSRVDVMTADDSLVQLLVQAGLITPEQSRDHTQKNELLAALGMEDEIEPHTVVRPVELLEGDAFLLCSDGWWEGFDHTDLVACLERADSPEAWLLAMRSRVLDRRQPRQDNFSAIAVWAGDPGAVTLSQIDDTMPKPTPRP